MPLKEADQVNVAPLLPLHGITKGIRMGQLAVSLGKFVRTCQHDRRSTTRLSWSIVSCQRVTLPEWIQNQERHPKESQPLLR
eukprot:3309438-Amphidinium_carterae.1